MTPEKIEMIQLIAGDARRIPLPDESVQCVVTSPPYFGLRKYTGEQELIWGGKAKYEHLFSLNTEPRRPHGEKDTTGAKQLSNVGANYDAQNFHS